MIKSDQIHVAMTKLSRRVATLVCQSNIFIENENEKADGICIASYLVESAIGSVTMYERSAWHSDD